MSQMVIEYKELTTLVSYQSQLDALQELSHTHDSIRFPDSSVHKTLCTDTTAWDLPDKHTKTLAIYSTESDIQQVYKANKNNGCTEVAPL